MSGPMGWTLRDKLNFGQQANTSFGSKCVNTTGYCETNVGAGHNTDIAWLAKYEGWTVVACYCHGDQGNSACEFDVDNLVLLQQGAVNLALRDVKQEGILAVNGPPGTGKTTLLRMS